jgi:hypothetical protein
MIERPRPFAVPTAVPSPRVPGARIVGNRANRGFRLEIDGDPSRLLTAADVWALGGWLEAAAARFAQFEIDVLARYGQMLERNEGRLPPSITTTDWGAEPLSHRSVDDFAHDPKALCLVCAVRSNLDFGVEVLFRRKDGDVDFICCSIASRELRKAAVALQRAAQARPDGPALGVVASFDLSEHRASLTMASLRGALKQRTVQEAPLFRRVLTSFRRWLPGSSRSGR